MDRAEKIGLGAAAVGHVLLFGLLSMGFLAAPDPVRLEEHPVEVSLVEDVAIHQASPQPQPAAPSIAPEQGAPEEAAPAPPVPAPPAPPAPTPPQPVPKPAPVKLAPKPAPAPKPSPAPAKPKPPEPAAERTPAKPAKPKAPEPAAERTPAKPAKPAAALPAKPTAKPSPGAGGEGAAPPAKPAHAKGSRLGPDFLKGLADAPPKPAAPSVAAPGPAMNAKAAADIGSAIKRQVQPCANRQVTPGPGAERIRVAINLRLNRDGSLAAPPRVVSHDGVDDDNRRYLDRVDDLAIAAFTACSPLTGLPGELYEVQNGWRNFTLRYKLPG